VNPQPASIWSSLLVRRQFQTVGCSSARKWDHPYFLHCYFLVTWMPLFWRNWKKLLFWCHCEGFSHDDVIETSANWLAIKTQRKNSATSSTGCQNFRFFQLIDSAKVFFCVGQMWR
jgi:hypothetical protein